MRSSVKLTTCWCSLSKVLLSWLNVTSSCEGTVCSCKQEKVDLWWPTYRSTGTPLSRWTTGWKTLHTFKIQTCDKDTTAQEERSGVGLISLEWHGHVCLLKGRPSAACLWKLYKEWKATEEMCNLQQMSHFVTRAFGHLCSSSVAFQLCLWYSNMISTSCISEFRCVRQWNTQTSLYFDCRNRPLTTDSGQCSFSHSGFCSGSGGTVWNSWNTTCSWLQVCVWPVSETLIEELNLDSGSCSLEKLRTPSHCLSLHVALLCTASY